MNDKFDPSLSTRVIHEASNGQRDAHGSPYTPIYTTTTFAFQSTADLLDVVEGRKSGSLYTRYGSNPTIRALECSLANLENAEQALAFSSGMAALCALFLTHGRAGIVCIGDVYGGTSELLRSQLSLLGIQSYFLLNSELTQLADLLHHKDMLVFFETPANPTLECLDITMISKVAHRQNALIAVDNTFASPVNQQPLALGADIVIHSATKYLGGHSDLTAGALMGSSSLLKPVWGWRKNLGTTISPTEAALLSRSLRTLVVRVKQHNIGAQRIAEAMSRHPKINQVYYPGLPTFISYALAQKQMQGFGGMMTIDIRGGVADAAKVADCLKLFRIAPSLGGVESLVSQPFATSHYDMMAEERERHGIKETMLRLSVGLEDPVDLIADLEQALSFLA